MAFGYEFRARTALGVAQVLLAVSAFSLIPNATGDALSFPARSTVCCCIALVVGGLAAVSRRRRETNLRVRDARRVGR